jgi:hypothetical protein
LRALYETAIPKKAGGIEAKDAKHVKLRKELRTQKQLGKSRTLN